jgi:hypothetical protein
LNPVPSGTIRYIVAEIIAYSIFGLVGFAAGEVFAQGPPR